MSTRIQFSSKSVRGIAMLLAGGLMLAASTGCMMTPGNNDTVVVGSPTYFAGATLDPNQQVQLQAYYEPWGTWHTFATVNSGNSAFNQEGTDMYFWSTHEVIPGWAWHWTGDIARKARLRAVDQGFGLFGQDTLPTFESGFFDYYEPDETVTELYGDHGAGREITVWAE